MCDHQIDSTLNAQKHFNRAYISIFVYIILVRLSVIVQKLIKPLERFSGYGVTDGQASLHRTLTSIRDMIFMYDIYVRLF